MTPDEYFALHPSACETGRDFCSPFNTMRAAWLHDAVEVSHMLWALSNESDTLEGIRAFAAWCAEQAKLVFDGIKEPRRSGWGSSELSACEDRAREAAAATTSDYALGYAVMAAGNAAGVAGCAGDVGGEGMQQAMREKLRELFPDMLVDQPQGATT